jgi:aminomethyltransferase
VYVKEMLKRTALFEEHVRLGGRMVDFGGWELPVQYTGVIDEHNACRTACGLFDVSHMGEVHVEGSDAEAFLDYLVPNNVAKLAIEQALYTQMCNEEGGIVDDLLIYRRGKDKFLMVVNASNTDKDYAWIQKVHAQFIKKQPNVHISNESANYTQIAIQGRKSAEILQKLTETRLSDIKYYWFKEGKVLGIPAVIAQTGYTGEYGFEIYIPWSKGPEVWRKLVEIGQPLGLKPVGLGARDTLRFEMRFPLYGHELSDSTNPLEAGIAWSVKLKKERDFIGKKPTVALKERGLQRQLVGLKIVGRGIPRQGYALYTADGSKRIGEITSGTVSPSLNLPLGIGYVQSAYAADGTKITVDVRGAKVPAEIIPTPFYKRPY